MTRRRTVALPSKHAVMKTICGPAEIIQDTGSRLNTKRKNLNKLIDMIINEEIKAVYITQKDC